MVKESRVLQWYIDCYGSNIDFNKLTEQEKISLMADTIFYSNQIIFNLQNQLESLKKAFTDLPVKLNGTL